MRDREERQPLRGWVPVAAAGGAVALGLAVAASGDLPGEMSLLRAVRAERDTAWYGIAQGVDAATGSWPLLAAAALLGLVLRSVQIPVAVALTAAVTAGAKRLVGRDRPDLISPLEEASHFSFPAGHAASAAAVVVAVLLVVSTRRRAAALVIGGALVVLSAWAQLTLARHFPSDLVGGWLTGGAVAAALAWFSQRVPGGAAPPRR